MNVINLDEYKAQKQDERIAEKLIQIEYDVVLAEVDRLESEYNETVNRR